MAESTTEKLLQQLRKAQQRANQANTQRLRQILGDLTPGGAQKPGGAQGLLGLFGRSATEDVNESARRQQAGSIQNLISSGLGNTTLQAAASRGVQSDRLRALRDIQERVATTKAGVLERVTDQGPDVGLIAQLIRQAEAGNIPKREIMIGAPQQQPFSQTIRQRQDARTSLSNFGNIPSRPTITTAVGTPEQPAFLRRQG